MTDLSEEEGAIVLEVSPLVDIEDHLELRYNLGALSSGIGSSDRFKVTSDDGHSANVAAMSDGSLLITVYGESIRQFLADDVDEAIMILVNGDDMPIEMEAGYEFDKEVSDDIDLMFEIVDRLDRRLDFNSSYSFGKRLLEVRATLDDLIDDLDC